MIVLPKYVQKAWGHELWIHNSPEYCGKLLVFNKGSEFSMHFHLIKEETWYVSSGEFEFNWFDTEAAIRLTMKLKQGDVINLKQGIPHKLKALSQDATIFEVSTEHYDSDSYRIEPGDSQKA